MKQAVLKHLQALMSLSVFRPSPPASTPADSTTSTVFSTARKKEYLKAVKTDIMEALERMSALESAMAPRVEQVNTFPEVPHYAGNPLWMTRSHPDLIRVPKRPVIA